MIAWLVAIICMCGGATGPYQQADRLTPPTTMPAWPTGIYDLPYAPFGLSNCEEANFYADQFGLPQSVKKEIWGESNCLNTVTSSTGCCRGYLQLDINLHLRDHRLGWRYRDICQVYQISDAFGNTPLQKQKQMCAAKQLYDVMGVSPWQ